MTVSNTKSIQKVSSDNDDRPWVILNTLIKSARIRRSSSDQMGIAKRGELSLDTLWILFTVRAMLARYQLSSCVCLSVRLSARLPRVGAVQRRLNLGLH